MHNINLNIRASCIKNSTQLSLIFSKFCRLINFNAIILTYKCHSDNPCDQRCKSHICSCTYIHAYVRVWIFSNSLLFCNANQAQNRQSCKSNAPRNMRIIKERLLPMRRATTTDVSIIIENKNNSNNPFFAAII